MLSKFLNSILNKKEEENNYIILGASAAGINAAKTLRELDENAKITVISKDEKIYSRCMLHHVISDHRTVEEINFVDENFMIRNNINWLKNITVKNIDTKNKIIDTDKGSLNYGKLLIATGASASKPPIENIDKGNYIYYLRNIDDVYKIKERAKDCKKVAIIGAGLTALDALMGLLELKNVEVSLLYRKKYFLNKQLDYYSAKTYENKFIEAGAKLYPSQTFEKIILHDNNDIKGIKLGSGDIVECDMLIVATGVKPNIDFVKNTPIETEKGILINDKCETNVKDVYAAGDVVGKNSIWPLAVKQGIVAAYNMIGIDKECDDHFVLRNSMNFFEIPTVSLGTIIPADDTYDVITRCDREGYKKFVIKDDIIRGFIAQGDISYTGPIAYLIKHKVRIPNLKERVFDLGYSDFFSMKENGEFQYNV